MQWLWRVSEERDDNAALVKVTMDRVAVSTGLLSCFLLLLSHDIGIPLLSLFQSSTLVCGRFSSNSLLLSILGPGKFSLVTTCNPNPMLICSYPLFSSIKRRLIMDIWKGSPGVW